MRKAPGAQRRKIFAIFIEKIAKIGIDPDRNCIAALRRHIAGAARDQRFAVRQRHMQEDFAAEMLHQLCLGGQHRIDRPVAGCDEQMFRPYAEIDDIPLGQPTRLDRDQDGTGAGQLDGYTAGTGIGHGRRRVCCLRYALPGVPGCGMVCPLPEGRF